MSCPCCGNATRVTIIGANGGVGQSVCLLLKRSPKIKELILYDLTNVEGVALDVSHINTYPKVTSYWGPENLKNAIKGTTIIVVTASVPRDKNITSRESFFDGNAKIIADATYAMVDVAPKAHLCIVTNPVNSLVPVASDILKRYGKLDARRIIGISNLDLVRASAFVADLKGLNAAEVKVPVICGHSSNTITPIFSQTSPRVDFTPDEIEMLTKKVINAGPAVVEAKGDKGCATLATAHAIVGFVLDLVDALQGKVNVVQYCFVRSDLADTKYFSSPVLLGKNGVDKILGYGMLSICEQRLLANAIQSLKEEIKKGEEYARKCSGCKHQ